MANPKLKVVIPGGSGQVGAMLAKHFHAEGHEVTVIARHGSAEPWHNLIWDGRQLGVWAKAVDGADVVINLAGRSVNCRYDEKNRREILESRVFSTRVVGEAIARAERPPKIWMNASTATIYRHAMDRPMDETSGELGGNEPDAPETWRFSIDVAKRWEEEFFAAVTPRTRKIALRSSMIMYPSRGGIFDTLLGLVRLRLGGAAGSGKQFVSWIHGDDFIRALEFLIERPSIDGVVNVCAANPLPYEEFMRELRRAWGTRIGLPATEWMIELGTFLMRTESELVLKSRRVVPGRLLNEGFEFQFPRWETASQDLVSRWRRRQS